MTLGATLEAFTGTLLFASLLSMTCSTQCLQSMDFILPIYPRAPNVIYVCFPCPGADLGAVLAEVAVANQNCLPKCVPFGTSIPSPKRRWSGRFFGPKKRHSFDHQKRGSDRLQTGPRPSLTSSRMLLSFVARVFLR